MVGTPPFYRYTRKAHGEEDDSEEEDLDDACRPMGDVRRQSSGALRPISLSREVDRQRHGCDDLPIQLQPMQLSGPPTFTSNNHSGLPLLGQAQGSHVTVLPPTQALTESWPPALPGMPVNIVTSSRNSFTKTTGPPLPVLPAPGVGSLPGPPSASGTVWEHQAKSLSQLRAQLGLPEVTNGVTPTLPAPAPVTPMAPLPSPTEMLQNMQQLAQEWRHGAPSASSSFRSSKQSPSVVPTTTNCVTRMSSVGDGHQTVPTASARFSGVTVVSGGSHVGASGRSRSRSLSRAPSVERMVSTGSRVPSITRAPSVERFISTGSAVAFPPSTPSRLTRTNSRDGPSPGMVAFSATPYSEHDRGYCEIPQVSAGYSLLLASAEVGPRSLSFESYTRSASQAPKSSSFRSRPAVLHRSLSLPGARTLQTTKGGSFQLPVAVGTPATPLAIESGSGSLKIAPALTMVGGSVQLAPALTQVGGSLQLAPAPTQVSGSLQLAPALPQVSPATVQAVACLQPSTPPKQVTNCIATPSSLPLTPTSVLATPPASSRFPVPLSNQGASMPLATPTTPSRIQATTPTASSRFQASQCTNMPLSTLTSSSRFSVPLSNQSQPTASMVSLTAGSGAVGNSNLPAALQQPFGSHLPNRAVAGGSVGLQPAVQMLGGALGNPQVAPRASARFERAMAEAAALIAAGPPLDTPVSQPPQNSGISLLQQQIAEQSSTMPSVSQQAVQNCGTTLLQQQIAAQSSTMPSVSQQLAQNCGTTPLQQQIAPQSSNLPFVSQQPPQNCGTAHLQQQIAPQKNTMPSVLQQLLATRDRGAVSQQQQLVPAFLHQLPTPPISTTPVLQQQLAPQTTAPSQQRIAVGPQTFILPGPVSSTPRTTVSPDIDAWTWGASPDDEDESQGASMTASVSFQSKSYSFLSKSDVDSSYNFAPKLVHL